MGGALTFKKIKTDFFLFSLTDEWLDACTSVAADLKIKLTPVVDADIPAPTVDRPLIVLNEVPAVAEDVNKV